MLLKIRLILQNGGRYSSHYYIVSKLGLHIVDFMPSLPTLNNEKSLWSQGYQFVAGIDEAGRGCLAGPVVAAAVLLPPHLFIPGVNDSKKLSPADREELATEIQAKTVAVSIGMCSPQEIDQWNILWATMEAMKRAANGLFPFPDYLLIDGNRCFPNSPWPFKTLVKGDARSHTIAAASIVAKTTRDRLMKHLHDEYPAYGWDTNVGYPTADHYRALKQNGRTPYHRLSFRLT